MSMDLLLLLTAYSVALVAASLLGGWLPRLMRMTHVRVQVAMSFVAGLMLGVALCHLLPHALVHLQSNGGLVPAIERVVLWAMAGLILMLLLLRVFRFHQHDFSDGANDHHGLGVNVHPLSWLGVAVGLGLHALMDGVALGADVKGGDMQVDATSLAGFGVFLAILLHKPLDALSITGLMQLGGWGRRARTLANVCFALLCPLGSILFVWQVGQLGPAQASVVGCSLAFAAGVFLCISLGDLLPEIHFHSHARLKMIVALLAGIGFAYGLRYVEPAVMHMN